MSDRSAGMVRRLPVIESVNALVAFLFAASAPVAIILSAGMRGGLEEADLASWIFAAFVINGVLTILMSVIFRQPLAFFWTIPGTVLVGAALPSLGFAEVIGAYILTGILLLVLGLAGWVRLIMDRLPMPIVMGMVAGVFVQFGLDWIHAFKSEVMLVTAMTATFFFLSAVPRLERWLPPMVAVLVVGVVMLLLGGDVGVATPTSPPRSNITTPTTRTATMGGSQRSKRGTADKKKKVAVIAVTSMTSLLKAWIQSRPNCTKTPATMPITIGIGSRSMINRTQPANPSTSNKIPVKI